MKCVSILSRWLLHIPVWDGECWIEHGIKKTGLGKKTFSEESFIMYTRGSIWKKMKSVFICGEAGDDLVYRHKGTAGSLMLWKSRNLFPSKQKENC